MASGYVPMVYAGSASGPWVDINDKGKHGLGFRSVEELAENIEKMVQIWKHEP